MWDQTHTKDVHLMLTFAQHPDYCATFAVPKQANQPVVAAIIGCYIILLIP